MADFKYRYDHEDDSEDAGENSYSSQSEDQDEGDSEEEEEGKDESDDGGAGGRRRGRNKIQHKKPGSFEEEANDADGVANEDKVPEHLKDFVPGDLRTVFAREPKEVLEERKLRSQLPLDRSPVS